MTLVLVDCTLVCFFANDPRPLEKPGATLDFVCSAGEWQIDKQWVFGAGTVEVVREAVSRDKWKAVR